MNIRHKKLILPASLLLLLPLFIFYFIASNDISQKDIKRCGFPITEVIISPFYNCPFYTKSSTIGVFANRNAKKVECSVHSSERRKKGGKCNKGELIKYGENNVFRQGEQCVEFKWNFCGNAVKDIVECGIPSDIQYTRKHSAACCLSLECSNSDWGNYGVMVGIL